MLSFERAFPDSTEFTDNVIRRIVTLPKAFWLIFGFLALVGLGFGLFLQPQLTTLALVAFGFGIPAVMFAWQYPEIILVVVVFLSSGFIAAKHMEVGGGLELRDVAFLGTLGLLAFQGILRKKLALPWPKVGGPLFVFLIIAVVSLINSQVFQNVPLNWAFNDMRILIYYGMFFSAAWAINTERKLMSVGIGLFIIADLIAFIIFAQQPLGPDNLLLESMYNSRWDIIDSGVAVRVVPAAHTLMHFMAVISFALIFYAGKSKKIFWFGVFQFVYLNTSLLLTLTRSQWLATAVGVFLICVVLAPKYKDRLIFWTIKYSVPTLLILIFIFGIFGSALLQTINSNQLVGGLIERASTIFKPSETLETNSLEWREFEIEKGFDALRENPLMGVSLGNSYREITTLHGEAIGWHSDGSIDRDAVSRFTRYIHSSYLAIAVKMGLIGFATFMAFCLMFVFEGWRLAKRMPHSLFKGVALAIVTSFIGLMQWSIFHTHFLRTESTIAVGIMTGIVAGINYIHEKNSRNLVEI